MMGPFLHSTSRSEVHLRILKVHISTSNWQTLVVVPLGCENVGYSNCPTLRGGEFFLNESTTWQTNMANPATNLYPLLVDPQLGYNDPTTDIAEFGFDVLSLAGTPGPTTLQNQTVGGFSTPDSYLGLLGIDPRASNFSSSPPLPSYLQTLRNQSLIPSLSWGYTAGSQYRKT